MLGTFRLLAPTPSTSADALEGSDKPAVGPKDFERRFTFVDGPVARSAGKSHVTREYYREKEWKKSGKQPRKHVSQINAGRTAPEFVVNVRDLGMNDKKPRKQATRRSKSQIQEAEGSLDLGSSKDTMVGYPSTVLGEGRVDPFDSYPIHASMDIHELVDHYVVVIPSLLMKHWSRTVKRASSAIELFDLYRQNPASFLAMLHHAAHHREQMLGLQEKTPQSIKYKLDTLAMVRKQMQLTSDKPPEDGLIVAVGLLANAERIWGDAEASRLHWRAARQMIANRGGFHGLGNNITLHTKLMYSFIALSGTPNSDEAPYIDPYMDSVGVGPSRQFNAAYAINEGCDELVALVSQSKLLALKALPTSTKAVKGMEKYPLRASIFQEGSQMYNLLAPQDPGYFMTHKRRALDNCRMACIAYLALTMVEYGNFSEASERFLKTLADHTEADNTDISLTAEHLLWNFIKGIEQKDTCDRTWQMSRIVGIAKRLRRERWIHLESSLLAFLRLPRDAEEIKQFSMLFNDGCDWREEALRELNDETTI